MGIGSWMNKALNDYLEMHGASAPEPPQDPDEAAFVAQWTPIYEKFRARMGRDPYSFRELQDWWAQV